MKSVLIDNKGNKIELNYYEIENKCIEIINNLTEEIKKKFNIFKENYQYFNPYFDFVIFELGYMIENPMDIENSLLISKNNKMYIIQNMSYDKYRNNDIQINDSEFYNKCDNVTLSIRDVPYKFEEIKNGIVDQNNIFLELGDMRLHNDLALVIVNQMLIKSDLVYTEYLNYKSSGNKAINFLESEFGYLRIGFIGKILLSYNENKISYKQEDYIAFLNSNNYLEKFDNTYNDYRRK